jgi:tetratricopeptide (TPR) repeat protein
MKAIYITLLLALLSPGCLYRALEADHYENYYAGARQAFHNGDYATAKRRYITAFHYAQSGFLGPKAEAAALYNYGLAAGLLGDFNEAESAIKGAMKLDEKTDGPEGPLASMRWLELARLYQAWGKFDESILAYEKGYPLAQKRGAEQSDPIGCAIVLTDYAAALESAGRHSRAQEIETSAKVLRESHPGMQAKIQIRYYPAKWQSNSRQE